MALRSYGSLRPGARRFPRLGSRSTDQLRIVVLTITVLFIVMLGTLTALDFVHHGVTVLGVAGAFIVLLFMIGIVGALGPPPKE